MNQPARQDWQTKQRSELAAQAAQHVIDLEQELITTKQERDFAHNQAGLYEEANKILHEQMAELKADITKLTRTNNSLHNRLRTVCKIIVDIVNDPDDSAPIGPAEYAPNEKSRVTAIAHETQPGPAIPEFLKEGPLVK